MGKLRRKIWVGSVSIAIMGLLLVGSAGVVFLCGRSLTQQEWERKLKPRTPAEIRGIMEALSENPQDPPNFVPQSMLDDEVCSAAVTNAINFTLGKEHLEIAPAWLFSKANAGKIVAKMVFDRKADFEVVQGEDGESHIVETFDRSFRLSAILDPTRIYVMGYHYHQTASDHKILESGGTWNSHLAWLLPYNDGHWYAYHLVHRVKDGSENPYVIDPVDQLPGEFDLVYIWELKDIVLPLKGVKMLLANYSLPFPQMKHWVNRGPSFLEYYVDTALVFLRNRFGGYEQFPTAYHIGYTTFVEVPLVGPMFHGRVLGAYRGHYLYMHIDSVRGKYGLEYQCVELINRYYVEELGYRNLTRTGHADSYLWSAKRKGLIAHMNGSSSKPQLDDILVFDIGNNDGQVGHVAIIIKVTDDEVCFVQQNFFYKNKPVVHDCLPMQQFEGGWYVTTIKTKKDYPPVAGWSRLPVTIDNN